MRDPQSILSTLPEQESPQVVYSFYDDAGALIYVGITKHFHVRCRQHSEKAWFAEVARVEIEPFANRAGAMARELALIAAHSPRHNRRAGTSGHAFGEGPSRSTGRVQVVIPPPLLAWLERRALDSRITLNECVVRLLEDAFELDDEYKPRLARPRLP